MTSNVKTTVLLREDVYEALVRENGKRGISEGINKAVLAHLHHGRRRKSMFGADPWLNTRGLRDHREPHEDL